MSGRPQYRPGRETVRECDREPGEGRIAESRGGGGQQRPRVMGVSLVSILKATGIIKGFWSDVHFRKVALPLEAHTLAGEG